MKSEVSSSWLTYRWCFPAPLTVDDDDVRSSATLLWESSSESISGHVVMICLLSTCWKKVFWVGIWGQVRLAKQKRFWEYELSYFWWTHRYRCWSYSEQYHFCQPAAVWCIFLSWGHFVPPKIVSEHISPFSASFSMESNCKAWTFSSTVGCHQQPRVNITSWLITLTLPLTPFVLPTFSPLTLLFSCLPFSNNQPKSCAVFVWQKMADYQEFSTCVSQNSLLYFPWIFSVDRCRVYWWPGLRPRKSGESVLLVLLPFPRSPKLNSSVMLCLRQPINI